MLILVGVCWLYCGMVTCEVDAGSRPALPPAMCSTPTCPSFNTVYDCLVGWLWAGSTRVGLTTPCTMCLMHVGLVGGLDEVMTAEPYLIWFVMWLWRVQWGHEHQPKHKICFFIIFKCAAGKGGGRGHGLPPHIISFWFLLEIHFFNFFLHKGY